ATPAALHQPYIERALQFLDLHRQGGLRHRALIGRLAEISSSGDRVEIAKLPKGDHSRSLLFPVRVRSENLIDVIFNTIRPDGQVGVESLQSRIRPSCPLDEPPGVCR